VELEDYATLAVLAGIWGASFLFIKVAVGQMSPVFMVFGRSLSGAVAVFIILRVTRVPLRGLRTHWKPGLVIAVFNAALPYTMFAFGETRIESSLAGILNATLPLWVALMAPLWVEAESLSLGRVAGLLLGFVGVVILARPSNGVFASSVIGILAILGATVSYAFASHFSRRFFQNVPPQIPALLQCVGATLILLPLAVVLHPARVPNLAAIGSVLALGLGGTGLAMILAYRLIKRVGASRTTIVTYLLPPFAILWGWLILHERPTPTVFLALAFILSGVFVITRPGRASVVALPEVVPADS
jgi:drug/metabolite transporter (DMT)-like permease